MNPSLKNWDKLQKRQQFYKSLEIEDFKLNMCELEDEIKTLNVNSEAKKIIEVILLKFSKKNQRIHARYMLNFKVKKYILLHTIFNNTPFQNDKFSNFQKKNIKRNLFEGVGLNVYKRLTLFELKDQVLYENFENEVQKKPKKKS